VRCVSRAAEALAVAVGEVFSMLFNVVPSGNAVPVPVHCRLFCLLQSETWLGRRELHDAAAGL
jgi:hypothetical protein